MKRRNFLRQAATASSAPLLVATGLTACEAAVSEKSKAVRKNNIHHSVARWCYGDIPLEELLPKLKAMGIHAIDLIGPEEWPILKKHGLDSSMCNGAEINLTDGWCDMTYHETLIDNYTRMIPLVAEAGYKNLILFSGNRRTISDKQGLENCVAGLQKIIPLAEQHQVVLQMELFNSKVDHPDYMCDNTPWAIELCKRLNSDYFKLLYDIYHMQISEGDIIRTIQDHHLWFGHYHTAGVPGRHEINDRQELNYSAIMQAIVETGFKGYVAQEFIPTYDDKLAALEEAITICDV